MNCNITENYFKEKARMTNYCSIKCEDCPMFKTGIECDDLETKHSKSAVQVVQKWSDEHHIKTYYDDFKERFPNCAKTIDNLEWCDFYANGEPRDDCGGLICEDCWNQPFPETTKDKNKTKMNTNRDKLQSLTNDELAEILAKDKPCSFCGLKNTECDYDEICSVRIKEWLESEVE